ncbi:conserved hypothetical protein [Dinoroseobacter shibae DFL 12 = DSM 16493]|uniref:Component of SufBCD complex n=1 Tax=Dinoroseobacter shibae (strain DSM 16493 / NCIMB 14021 / DFL 12) TaxID=398580 RepID=A8LKU0_DINSH|nr:MULTISPECIES: hypothetical protein [Dinoroseobacter]ABV93304.1 conserved hypothetical protein [Dinoroseobacter shibae DFL 12 = DSM 16493]MDD9715605.1 component of SufBCD complex [Dinoroseobacter sp. PD6]URF48223.1 component of SufBCD complex [Dinoroseobacter shibae]URF52533.1 component of SufBCD complex [Dinoroseobacter shibae]
MDLYLTIAELIDTRSFSSVWFWITLAVFWSIISHYVVGVPFDLVQRAQRRDDPRAWDDLERLSRINARRLSFIGSSAGLIVTGVAGFVLSALFLLGFAYRVELCQALFLLAFPFCLVSLLTQRTAREILAKDPTGEDLVQGLKRHRLYTQLIGIVSIFVTAFWGIWQTMSTGVLGN